MNRRDTSERNNKLIRDNDLLKRLLMGEENTTFDEDNSDILAEFLQQDEQQLINSFHQSPKRTLQRIVLTVIQRFQPIFLNIIKELEQQNHFLINKLKVKTENIQQLVSDNEHFKDKIQELQQERKQVQTKFSQSESENYRFREDQQQKGAQHQRLKQQHCNMIDTLNNLRTYNQQLLTQNRQCEQTIANFQFTLANIENSYEELMYQHDLLHNKSHNLKLQLHTQRQKSQLLAQRLNIKQEFIASCADQYNKRIYLKSKQQPSSCAKYKNMEEECEGRLPEIYIRNLDFFFSQHNRTGSKETSALRNIASKQQQHLIFDNFHSGRKEIKIMPFHTETKSKISSNKKRYPLQPTKQKVQGKKVYFEQVSPLTKKDKQMKNSKTSQSGLSSGRKQKLNITKTINEGNSKRLANDKRQINPFSLVEESKTPEHILSKKISEKDQKISALQSELKMLRNQYREQRQIVTLLEGEYELKMEDIEDQLSDTKNCLSDIYSKYALKKAECETYQQELDDIKRQISALREQYKKHLASLKHRLKSLFISHFNELEDGYLTIIEVSSQLTSQYENRLSHSLEGEGRNSENISQKILQIKSSVAPNLNQQSICSSEIKFQQIVSNKQIRGVSFNLDFSSEKIDKPERQEYPQIYIFQNYVVSSNLGAMTERVNIVNREDDKVCFTDRRILEEESMEFNSFEKSRNNIQTKLTVNSKVYEQSILNHIKKFDFFSVIDLSFPKLIPIEQTGKDFQITSQFSILEQFPPQPARFNLQSNIYGLHFNHKKQSQSTISQMLHIKVQREQIAAYEITSNVFSFRMNQTINKLANTMNGLSFINLPSTELIDCMCETQTDINKYIIFQQRSLLSRAYSLTLQPEHMQTSNNGQMEKVQTIQQQQFQERIVSFEIKYQPIQHDNIRIVRQEHPSIMEVKHQIQSVQMQKDSQIRQINDDQSDKLADASPGPIIDEDFQNITFIQANEQQVSNSDAQTIKDHNYMLQQFFDMPKQITNIYQATNSQRIPPEITENLRRNELSNLQSFLNKYDYSLELKQIVIRPRIKKPSSIKQQVIIFSIADSAEQKYFLLSQHQLSSLTTKQHIQFNKQRVIDSHNFMFGQSEVIFTSDGYLIVRREGKRNKLKGTLPDHKWKIDSYFVCRCKPWDKFYCRQ